MVDAIRAIQSVCDVPLQIDSTIPEVLEAGLRIYCGKPIVNSVNGEENSLNNVLPLVKKYGACVVGLALDENGIPKTAPERVAIAKKILDRALAIGIPKENVFMPYIMSLDLIRFSECRISHSDFRTESLLTRISLLWRSPMDLHCRLSTLMWFR